MSWTIPQTHFLSHSGALWELQIPDKGDRLWIFCWWWSHFWRSEIWVHRVLLSLALLNTCLKICCPHLLQTIALCHWCFPNYPRFGGSTTLWIMSHPNHSLHYPRIFIVVQHVGSQCEFGLFSARRAVIEGRSLTRVSLSWAQRAQQIDSPRLLPFSTDRLGAWALSQHYQSIRSYPQPLTLIGGPLPKGQGSMNHSPAMRSCYASKYTCCGSKSLRCLAANDSLSGDCHSPVTKL